MYYRYEEADVPLITHGACIIQLLGCAGPLGSCPPTLLLITSVAVNACMQAASPGLLVISDYNSAQQPSLNMTVQGLTLTCSQAIDASFTGVQATANSSAAFLAAVTAVSALGLDAVIDLNGTVTASVSNGWPASGISLGPGTTLTLTSSSPAGAVLDLDMSAHLIRGLTNNTLRISNLTLVNLCSDLDSLQINNYKANNVTATSSLPVMGFLRPYNEARVSLVMENVTMLVPSRDVGFAAYWYVM